MTDFTCPICHTTLNDDEYRVGERLGSWGYMHLDVWLKCPTCGYTPVFGRELSDSKPVYWNPRTVDKTFKRGVLSALRECVPTQLCAFCRVEMQLHKVWVNSWKPHQVDAQGDLLLATGDEETKHALHFRVNEDPMPKDRVADYWLPSGILVQYKCPMHTCKYVRYVTL